VGYKLEVNTIFSSCGTNSFAPG